MTHPPHIAHHYAIAAKRIAKATQYDKQRLQTNWPLSRLGNNDNLRLMVI